jgi:hypothetical protein
MAETGVHRRGMKDQELARCPWHNDREPSLSINWAAAIFNCFSTWCDKRGGIGTLRRLLDRDTPTYRQMAVRSPEDVSAGDNLGCIDVEAEQARLAAALDELGEVERAQKLRDCRQSFRVGKCTNCARTPAYPLSCGDAFCLRCMPGRLAADWQRHEKSLPPRLTLLRLRPTEAIVPHHALKKVRGRFREWRKREHVASGIYGVRLDSASGGVILLGIPSEDPPPASTRAFQVEIIAEDRPMSEFVRWLQQEYIDEAVTWHDAHELADAMLETKARRRFQGFGAAYGRSEDGSATDADTTTDAGKPEPNRPLGRVCGGALKGKRATSKPACGFCGGKVEWYEFTVASDQVQKIGDHWLWMGPPKRSAA